MDSRANGERRLSCCHRGRMAAMCQANLASTTLRSDEVAQPDHLAIGFVEAVEDAIEQITLSVFKKPPCRIGAQIRHLDHAGEAAVDKKRRFDDPLDLGPQSALLMKTPHETRYALSNGFVVILNQ